ncbi:MAG: tRNA pseudouridine32 synthase/23S rRNA pseudouridine746 synthase [Polaribacter sp.]|jgi:tRNA pseudouridine32 synthase/23S rRNA pseudouridine746 synthase
MTDLEPSHSVTSQPIESIFQNTDFIALNKPEGASFHNENNLIGFFNFAKQYFKIPLWPVHRLDKLTSGIIILAKSAKVAQQFGAMFEDKLIEKTYLAISDKKPIKKQGNIIGDMKKSRNGSWMLTKGKINPAHTKFHSFSLIPKMRLFVIKPLTGKTHQIRVALKSLGSPILGDSRYAGNNSDRAYLHAFKIKFIWNNKVIEIENKPTQGELFQLPEMQKALEKLSSNANPLTQ